MCRSRVATPLLVSTGSGMTNWQVQCAPIVVKHQARFADQNRYLDGRVAVAIGCTGDGRTGAEHVKCALRGGGAILLYEQQTLMSTVESCGGAVRLLGIDRLRGSLRCRKIDDVAGPPRCPCCFAENAGRHCSSSAKHLMRRKPISSPTASECLLAERRRVPLARLRWSSTPQAKRSGSEVARCRVRRPGHRSRCSAAS